MARTKRKIFDSGRQRATGSDITIDNVIKARREREMLGGTFPRPKTSWREKHETFVNAISVSKHDNCATHTGTPFAPITPIPNDYVKCDYCERRFNQAAAERHIPFCKTQSEKKRPIKIQKQSNATKIQTNNDSQISNASLNRTSRITSKKPDSHSVIPGRHSSRRSESTQRSFPIDHRREMSSSRIRNNSVTRSANKCTGQISNASEQEKINSSGSYQSNDGERVSRQLPATKKANKACGTTKKRM
uniref:C2HC/C3H-type domain-containing protein n=1 Tax=Setaria digitata TaxID=48799 RepID=A0A915PE61_9BILA